MSFELFYSAYPRKQAKKDAQKAWKQIKNPPLEMMLSTLAWQKKTKQWQDGFIPLPATWLRGERWLDEPMVKPREDKPAPKPPTIYKDGVPQLATAEQKSNIFNDFKEKFLRKHK